MKKVTLSKSIKQITFRHMSSYSVVNDSRGWIHLYEIINILSSVIPEEEIKKEYKDYEEIKGIMIRFGKKVYYINHYFSLIKDSDFKNSNVWNESYRNFLIALSDIPVIHSKILRFFSYLIDKTSLTNETIPSEYIAQAKADLIKFESESDMEKKFLERRKQYFENKLTEKEYDNQTN
ncbi:MAG: hypothetical protein ABH804_00050 [archaeon]